MKKALLFPVLFLFAAVVIMGCACNQQITLPSGYQPDTFDAEEFQPKVNNFMVVFDASQSMTFWDRGCSRIKRAMTIVSNINQSLPEMPIEGGLRSFGHNPSVSNQETVLMYGLTTYTTSGFQSGLDRLTVPGGFSPMAAAIDAAGEDLGSATGKIALILVSDGEGMGEETLASVQRLNDHFGGRLCIYTIHVGDNKAGGVIMRKMAQLGGCGYAKNDMELDSGPEIFAFVKDVFLEKRVDKDQDGVYDDQDACPDTPAGVDVNAEGCPFDTDGDGVYDYQDNCPNTPAGVGVDSTGCPLDADGDGVSDDQDACPQTPAGVDVDTKGCPFDTDGDGVYNYEDNCPGTPAGVSVDTMGCPFDTDGDGVYNYEDNCPDTPAGVSVDIMGCPFDTDGDGVYNYQDNCPDTPEGTEVDYRGCELVKATKSAQVTDAGTWLYKDIQFDTGSAKIKSASFYVLDEIAALLMNTPGLKVEIQGHTDSAGGRDMNMKLSRDRAESVAAYLVQRGVAAEQLTTEGYGPSRPIASNDSAAGRAKNRRVELKPIK